MGNDENLTRKLTPADERLRTQVAEWEQKSLETIDAAARQIIGLTSTLLGLIFGILAFKDGPTYLAHWEVKFFGLLALVGFLSALIYSLVVTMPRRYQIPTKELSAMRAAYEDMLQRKSKALTRAQYSFVAGITGLILIVLQILLSA